MSLVTTLLGRVLSPLVVPYPFWAVKLRNQRGFLSELDMVEDQNYPGNMRPFDWTLDLIDTGDIWRVEELWLFCPPHPENPLGQTARLPITEPGTAFQFKIGNLMGLTENVRSMESLVIGRVNNKETGACEAIIWDAYKQRMIVGYHASVYDPPGFGTWSHRVAPIVGLSHRIVGLNLS